MGLSKRMLKKSISIKGHRTSIALEEAFWDALTEIATNEAISLPRLIARIDRERLTVTPPPGLASALRVHVLTIVRDNPSGIGDETRDGTP